MLIRLIFIFICTLNFSCTNSVFQDQNTKFSSQGKPKATVAILPVFDTSNTEIGWSLSEEFTSNIRENIQKKMIFLLNSPEELNNITTSLNEKNNPFSNDYSWVKETFKGYEYVVFTELVEHDIHAKPLKGNFFDKLTPSSELSLTMRIRIFNLNGSKPQIVLQELINQTHLIPRPSNLNQIKPTKWKTVAFNISPLGLSHSQFTKKVCKRIEDYILLSNSN